MKDSDDEYERRVENGGDDDDGHRNHDNGDDDGEEDRKHGSDPESLADTTDE